MSDMGARIGLALAVALAGIASSVSAQEGGSSELDLAPPDLSAPQGEGEGGSCPGREPRPEWIDELKGWDSIRGLVVSEIYQARSYERIVSTGECPCAYRAPPWDAAEAEYQEDYGALDNTALREVRENFQILSGSLHQEARRICREQGNW